MSTVTSLAASLLLGNLWNWTLYGVLIVQTYVYGYNFPDDNTSLKLLVYAIFLLETLQTALSGADLYHWFVSGFSEVLLLASPYASPFDVPIMGSIVSYVVQLFFVYRIWVLSKKSSKLLCLIICLVSTLDTIAAVGAGVYSQKSHAFARSLDPTDRALVLTWLSGNTLSDLLITGSMLYYLGRRRSKGDGYFSDHALSRIVRLTVETNVITTTVGVVTLFLVAMFSNSERWAWYTCPIAIIGKLYSNTLLVSLNNRIFIREVPVCQAQARVGSPAVMFPVTFRPRVTSSIVHVEPEKPSAALLVARSSSRDSAGQDGSSNKIFDIA